jgi:hypothetical protein
MEGRAFLVFISYLAWQLPGVLGQNADFDALCTTERDRRIQKNSSLKNDSTFACAQNYDEDRGLAQTIEISLAQCRAESPGWQMSKFEKPSQWAGPLVSFLLPALAFIIVIPREIVWRVKTKHLDGGALFWLPVSFFVLTLDLLVLGIPVVFGWAGPFIAGAFYEALIDQAVLKAVKSRKKGEPMWMADRYAIALTLVGSFAPDIPLEVKEVGPVWPQPRDGYTELPQHRPNQRAGRRVFGKLILDQLVDPPTAKLFMNRVCGHFWSFSQVVGVPLIFYVGAFIFGLIDAKARLGENDTAHSIAFGLWYIVVVFVALASSLVLGLSSPTAIEGILAITKQHYKHKWLSERRTALAGWASLKLPNDTDTEDFKNKYSTIFAGNGYALIACGLALLSIGFPCVLAIVVSYHTPKIGFSCRSTTVLAYMCSQALLIFLWFFHSSPAKKKSPVVRLAYGTITGSYMVAGFLASAIAIGGTVMQLLGVYRNCTCKAGLWYGLPTTRDISGATVLLSTDTAEMRESAKQVWTYCGAAGIIWLLFWCICSAAHRVRMRQRCLNLVNEDWNMEKGKGSFGVFLQGNDILQGDLRKRLN